MTDSSNHSKQVYALMSPAVDGLLAVYQAGVPSGVIIDAALSIFISIVVSFGVEDDVKEHLPTIIDMIEEKRAQRIVSRSLATETMQ